MASLYQRKDSPFFWIKYRAADGTIKAESTRCRVGISTDIRRARIIELQKSAEELQRGDSSPDEHGWSWVRDWLKIRYHTKAHTLERYLTCWSTLSIFLEQQKISTPAELRRDHCYSFVTWRQKPDKASGKYAACYNTALQDLKTLRIILHEAVERRLITGNPCVKLGLRKEEQTQKPELTDEDCAKIRAEIQKIVDPDRKEMLSNSFEIARHQGCRISETLLNPMTDVDLVAGTIHFNIKGARDHITALHPALRPLFAKLQADKRTTTWTDGNCRQWPAVTWFRFLRKIGLKEKGICFHSNRVTVATEMARNNVPENKAMAYIGHSSTTVHRIYQRLRPRDVSGCADVIAAGKHPSSSRPDGL